MDTIYKKVLDRYLNGSYSTKRRVLKEYDFNSESEFFEHIGYDPSNTSSNPLLDYVIAFDTTGSMGSYIAAVRSHVTELIPQLIKENPNINIGIVAFGDYEDKKSIQEFGDAYQSIDLTNNQRNLINFVRTAKNTYGGDRQEFYELVIRKINEETNWRKGSTKTVLLIADCDPHRVGYTHSKLKGKNTIDWRVEARKAAELGIQYDTLTINPKYAGWYKELSQITDGISIPFDNSNRTQEVVYASATSRGGIESTTMSFMASMDTAETTGDEEMTRVYKSLRKKLVTPKK